MLLVMTETTKVSVTFEHSHQGDMFFTTIHLQQWATTTTHTKISVVLERQHKLHLKSICDIPS